MGLEAAARSPVVLDMDPGIDDALALEYVVATKKLELRAITCVAGNVPAETGFRNARGLASLLGIEHDVPVYKGCAQPLRRRLHTAQ